MLVRETPHRTTRAALSTARWDEHDENTHTGTRTTHATFQDSATLVSIGLFFSIVTVGLASALPSTLSTGLIRYGVPGKAATAIAHLPPTAALFGAFLGYNPIGELIPPAVLRAISPTHQAILLGKTFFPNLISTPFMNSLHAVFYISAALCLIGAAASLLRGKRVVYGQEKH